ncbi:MULTISPECIES: hypothetical protein [unclassified Nodularia (in: cyanobacteria)]|uniref:hypothetical protein n=1 Tax=unclassified Nodularia (in: cyanobacteria) TaxID=2656917 RepID=UPI00187F2C8D|nr:MULTISPECIES: hypothetical protein [unclassified Nodularia (in: cyanobacteria)]MBE9202121.1 hypothetical protein [Nodularia sp. LEGE 06071]MCC2695171.1 hypothetical protein [Nodularia sp. LEGE 04288]
MKERELFKKWIRDRFITEAELADMPLYLALCWSEAMKEIAGTVRHQIVPFRRRTRRGSSR